MTAVPPGRRGHGRAAEPDDVARLGHGDVDGENGGVGHAVEREDRAVEIGDGDDHPRVAVQRQADDGAGLFRRGDGALHDGINGGLRQQRAGSGAGEVFVVRATAVGGGDDVGSVRVAGRCAADRVRVRPEGRRR